MGVTVREPQAHQGGREASEDNRKDEVCDRAQEKGLVAEASHQGGGLNPTFTVQCAGGPWGRQSLCWAGSFWGGCTDLQEPGASLSRCVSVSPSQHWKLSFFLID